MRTPIRVLQVFGNMNRGGAETMIMNLYRKIDRRKIQFDFIVHTIEQCAFDDEIISLGGRIFSVPRYHVLNHLAYVKHWDTFFQVHPEYHVIHAHIRSTASIFLGIAHKYGLVTISHSHSTANGSGLRASVKNGLQSKITADYYCACSWEAGKWLFGDRVNQNNFKIVRNAIDANAFRYDEEKRRQIREEFCLNGRFVVGTVGRLTPSKNPYKLLSVFEEIHRKTPKASLLWVGTGGQFKAIKEKVAEKQLSDCVIFTGSRNDVPDLMSAMDFFLFPSKWEGLGIVLIEAQAAGLRCLASDVIPGEAKITDLVEFISLDESAKYWADRALAYQDGYPREDMVRTVTEAGYDIHDMAEKLVEFYMGVGSFEK